MSTPFYHVFKCTYYRGETEYIATEVTYQRNGVSGEGFHVVKFTKTGSGSDGSGSLIGVIFEASKHVAVIDPLNLDSHWRGDNFEAGLREVIAAWDKARAS